jgi:hypothetical protein
MKKMTLLALTAGAIISVAGPSSAQGIYLDLGPNGCQPGWTVQDGLCKPYRGY